MTMKKAVGLMCCAALVLTMAGCKKNTSTVTPAEKNDDVSSDSSYAKVTTTVTQTGVFGEKTEMADVEINVNKIYRSEYYGSQDGVLSNVIFLDVTITNNTDSEINAHMLTSFDFMVDGQWHDSATLLAISSSKKQFGNDVNLFEEPFMPGDTQTGIIPAELPRNFYNAELYFKPLGGKKGGGDTSKSIVYPFTDKDLERIEKPQNEDESETETVTEAQE